jgi:hypothetical protein
MNSNPRRYLIGRNRQAELLVSPKSDDPNHFNFYCVNGDWDGNFKQGLVTIFGGRQDNYNYLKEEQKGYEILAIDNSGQYHEVFSRYSEDQNKTKSQIELEIKKMQENHTVVKSAKDILQAFGYPSSPQIERYIRFAESRIRNIRV